MKHILWIALLVLGVIVQGCGSEKPEVKAKKTSYWTGYWKVNPKSIENARKSSAGMAFFEDGALHNGSFNKGTFYAFSKNGKWGIADDKLLIIEGNYTNKVSYSILTNQEVLLNFPASKLYMVKTEAKSK